MAALAAAADSRAYGQLVQRHQGVVRGFLRRLCQDASAADDIAQETFLKAYQKVGVYQGPHRFRSWLLSIAYREFLMHRRREKWWLKYVGLGTMDREAQEESIPEPETTDSGVEAVDQIALTRALAELGDAAREAILLCEVYGFSQTEAAELMQLPLGTLKSHVLRGRQRLKALLAVDTKPGS